MNYFKDYNFEIPFDLLYIPSKGIFYSGKTPYFIIQYLTAKEESILTSPSLSESGMASKMVIDSVVINKEFDIGEMLVGDRNAVALFLRSTSYGDSFPLKYSCPKCQSEQELDFKLSSLESKDVDEVPNEKGLFSFVLPKSKVVVEFSPTRIKDEEEIKIMMESSKKMIGDLEIKNEVTARYLTQIKSINDNYNKEYIKKFIKKMSLIDSSHLREFMKKVEPGINSIVDFNCAICDHEFKDDLRINDEILKLPPEHRENVNEEIFLISYYSNGGMNKDQAFRMSIADRRWNINRISKEIEKKNKAEEDAMRKAKKK